MRKYRDTIRNILSYAFDISRYDIQVINRHHLIYCQKYKTEYIAKVLGGEIDYGHDGEEDVVFFDPINIFKEPE